MATSNSAAQPTVICTESNRIESNLHVGFMLAHQRPNTSYEYICLQFPFILFVCELVTVSLS
jgi:hypothetical protein